MSRLLQGLPAAPGIGMGTLFLYRPGVQQLVPPAGAVQSPGEEWRAFEEACARLDAELAQQATGHNTLAAELFAAHREILQDHTLLDGIRRRIEEEGASAFVATQQVVSELTDLFHSLEDEYFAGRATDIRDLGHRLLLHLNPAAGASSLAAFWDALPPQAVLLADDLTPSELALLPVDRIQGIGLAHSTPTAHSAILAHSMGIPMICALGVELLTLEQDLQAVLDGTRGRLLIEPDEAEARGYVTVRESLSEARIVAGRHAQSPAVTLDGTRIPVFANANRPADIEQASAAGAEGIGLLRTEYLFQERSEPPSVEEQTAIYTDLARRVRGPLIVRALDAGGDKPVCYIDHPVEENPFLGLRGIRLLLEQPALLLAQYRALQHAAQAVGEGNAAVELRFLLPMISTMEELAAVCALVQGEDEALPPLPLGIMIEVPSAALMAASLAPLVDFLSIGTNDLAQYTLAVDRTNSAVARLADPLHPAVLQLIQITCWAGHLHNKPIAVCGEIAGDPTAIPLLLGLGVTELSAPLPDIAQIKEAVRKYTLDACRELASAALQCTTAAEVRALLVES